MPDSGFPPVQARGRGAGWYRGDCHIHSVYSDGELTPEQLAADARTVGLDFIATTEHNSANAHSAWGRHAADDFLVLLDE
ncbi:PHP domain-containing protein [Streptomyces sp. NPDC056669]|uniref:PHP domain-containing protein n=1 Tax=Streptomyces sp. NPDC056669 TaxID=3345903 RepID=UPI0036A90244